MFYASIGALSLVVVAIVAYPLMRRRDRVVQHGHHALNVYRDQLDEIERDLARGLLSEIQADAARIEIKRRIVAATKAAKTPIRRTGAVTRVLAMAVIAIGLPAGAVSLYLSLGMPERPDQPLAQRSDELKVADHVRQLGEFSKTLAARLERSPDDAEGWSMLGRIYRTLGRFSESAKAFARVHALRPGSPAAALDHGEALVHSSSGYVPEAAERMFVSALQADPKDIRARYYLGAALAQRPDEISRAIEIWRDLEKDSPPDAPWLGALRENIRMAAAELAGASGTGGRPSGGN